MRPVLPARMVCPICFYRASGAQRDSSAAGGEPPPAFNCTDNLQATRCPTRPLQRLVRRDYSQIHGVVCEALQRREDLEARERATCKCPSHPRPRSRGDYMECSSVDSEPVLPLPGWLNILMICLASLSLLSR
jgi:hypothetical protein